MGKAFIIIGAIVLLLSTLFATGVIKFGAQQETPKGGEITKTPPAPTPEETKNNVITIKDCAADPQILEIEAGQSVTFKNADSVDHTLFSQEIGGEVKLAANASLTVTPKFPFKSFTTNYTCDQQGLPKGGAIYAKP